MEAESPIKHWIHKYSPVKRRDNPLPAPPSSKPSSERASRALQPTSANTSSHKSANHPKSRLRSIFSKDQLNVSEPPSPPRRTQHSQPSPHGIRKSLGRRHDSRDLRRLSQKVSSLESQLKEARNEIKSISTHTSRNTSRQPSRPTSVEREQMLDAEKLRRQLSTVQEDRYDGLAEHLLSQSYRDRQGAYQTLACKSTSDLGRAEQEQADLEADEESYDLQDNIYRSLRHRRDPSRESQADKADEAARRSKLRQRSWDQIQTTLSSERDQDRKRRHSSVPEVDVNRKPAKRSRRASSFNDFSSRRDKELPAIRGKPADQPRPQGHDTSSNTKSTLRRVSGPSSTREAHGRRKSLPNPPLELVDIPRLEPPKPSNPSSDQSNTQPRKGQHRRRQSQVISRDDVEEAFGNERPQTRGKQGEASTSSSNWTTHPPSPRRGCNSPSRLERVDEEEEDFVWDEDVF